MRLTDYVKYIGQIFIDFGASFWRIEESSTHRSRILRNLGQGRAICSPTRS